MPQRKLRWATSSAAANGRSTSSARGKKDKAFACDRLEEGEPAKAISQTPNHGQVGHANPYPFSVTDLSLLCVSSSFLTVFRSGDIANVFDKCLPCVKKLMLQQIEATRERGGTVNMSF